MGIKARLGAGVWDFLLCQGCGHYWTSVDVDLQWTDDPEYCSDDVCPRCETADVVREERG